eukprot:scaffold4161_cov22-Prasinocladus_malaysianus.AAC.2
MEERNQPNSLRSKRPGVYFRVEELPVEGVFVGREQPTPIFSDPHCTPLCLQLANSAREAHHGSRPVPLGGYDPRVICPCPPAVDALEHMTDHRPGYKVEKHADFKWAIDSRRPGEGDDLQVPGVI